MKTTIFFIIILSFVIISITSCESVNYKMITAVEKDGSFQRTVYTKADSAFFAGDLSKNPFMFDIDSTWKISYQTDSAYDVFSFNKKLIHVAGISQKFNSFEDFNRLQFHDQNRILANPEESVNKKFRWFFTYYSYKVVYQRLMDDLLIPLERYMTEAQQKTWLQGEMSQYAGWSGSEIYNELSDIEREWSRWFSHYLFEVYYNSIYLAAENHNVMYASQLPDFKDSIFQLNHKKIFDDEWHDIDTVIEMIDGFFDTSDFSLLLEKQNDEIENYFKPFLPVDIFEKIIDYELILPGKILQTNAPVTSGDTLKWKIDATRLIPSEFVLTAESRSVNIWAFAVTLVLAVLIIYFVVKR